MDKKIFNQNLQWLKKHNHALFQKIRKTKPLSTLLTLNKQGLPNLIKKYNGKDYPIYSDYNIGRQCSLWLDNLPKATGKQIIVIYGMGLGYELLELLNSEVFYSLLIIEPDEEIFYYNLHFFDLSCLEKHNVYFIQDNRPEEISRFISEVIKQQKSVKFFFSPLPGYDYLFRGHIEQIQLAIKEKINALLVSINTVRSHDKQWVQNYILNLKQLFNCVPVERFGSIFNNVPAVMVGAGPSLENDLPILKELYDKALIVPVGSAFSVLENNGIKGHAVGAIDGSFAEARLFEKNEYNQDIALFFSFMVNYKVLPMFKREKFFFALHSFDQYVYSQLAQECVKIASGASVSISVLDLLAKMGCNPIILVGQDLCYSKNQTYAKGATYFEETRPEFLKGKGYIETKNKHGELVYTTRSMLAMRSATEALIKIYPETTFINCTQYGLPIAGAYNACLEDIKKEKLNRCYEISQRFRQIYQNHKHIVLPEQVLNIINQIEAQATKIKEYCAKIITTIEEVFNHTKDNRFKIKKLTIVKQLEKKLDQLLFYNQVIKQEVSLYNFLFNNLSEHAAQLQEIDLPLEAKKRYYSKIYELCLIVLNAIQYGDAELQSLNNM